MPSTVAAIKTASTTPRAPGPPKAVGTNRTSATLAWDAPADDGGSPVLSYEAELQPKCRGAVQDGGLAQEWVMVYQARPG
jgi:hypothetical protein